MIEKVREGSTHEGRDVYRTHVIDMTSSVRSGMAFKAQYVAPNGACLLGLSGFL